MIVYFRKNCKRQIFHVLSHARSFCQNGFETIPYDPSGKLDEIENSPDNYLFFSVMMPRDLRAGLAVIEKLKQKHGRLNLNVVMGGTLFTIIEPEEILRHFPDVTHVIEGKGEAFASELLRNRLPPGAYRAADFPLIENVRIHSDYLPGITSMLLTFDDNRCSWMRCRFCHHTPGHIRRKRVSPEILAADIAYYYSQGIREFYLYDNEMIPENLTAMLHELRRQIGPVRDICLRIFGARVDADFSSLEPAVWKSGLIESISLGVEFYSQELLDLHEKGITLAQIDRTIQRFIDIGTQVNVYLLLGIPGEQEKHLLETRAFIEENKSRIFFVPSFFRLSSGMPLYRQQKEFGIHVQEPYRINEMVEGSDLPPAATRYLKFTCNDADTGQIVTRARTAQKVRDVLGDALYLDCFMIFAERPV